MPKKGIVKVDKNVSYRILEEQEKYVRNLCREKQRKNINTTPSQEVRNLLDLGIRMHRDGRREKLEMSTYFRTELRTFTDNFFKENDQSYISRLTEIRRYTRFIALLLMECFAMLHNIYWMMRDQSPFEEDDTIQYKKEYFARMESLSNTKKDEALEDVFQELGQDGEGVKIRLGKI